MKQFIISEAREKAAEIEAKARSESEAKKQQDILMGKKEIDNKFAKDLAEAETQVRVNQAKQKKQLDDSVLQARVEATTSIEKAAIERLKAAIGNRSQYAKLMQQLTVQAAFSLEGSAKVRCRPTDRDYVDLAQAAGEAEALLRLQGRETNITLEWDSQPLPEEALGGVLLTLDNAAARLENGGITCDNTLRSRLGTCIEEYAPVLRRQLFSEKALQSA